MATTITLVATTATSAEGIVMWFVFLMSEQKPDLKLKANWRLCGDFKCL